MTRSIGRLLRQANTHLARRAACIHSRPPVCADQAAMGDRFVADLLRQRSAAVDRSRSRLLGESRPAAVGLRRDVRELVGLNTHVSTARHASGCCGGAELTVSLPSVRSALVKPANVSDAIGSPAAVACSVRPVKPVAPCPSTHDRVKSFAVPPHIVAASPYGNY
jgi:hypothetical protein